MQAATGSVSWVAAQPSVLGRYGCGGGAPSAPARGTARGGGGGCGVRAVGVARCCARAQEKRPPRVRKTKEERRELVESFISSYRMSNDGKFPSVNLTHKEVGGSYYIVREIVRDIIQENKVLGPGGLNATVLSFEDCLDSSDSLLENELGQDTIEIVHTSDDSQIGMDSASEISNIEERYSLQNNMISTQTLLGSSNVLEAGVLNSVAQNGSAAGTACLETSLEKQDEIPSGGSIEVNSSEEQGLSSAHVSDSDKEIELESLGDTHERTGTTVTNGVIRSSEPSAVYETNGALLSEHETSPGDSHDGTADDGVYEANLLVKTNGVVHTEQTTLKEHETLSVSSDDGPIMDDQFSSVVSVNPMDGSNSRTVSAETEVTTKTTEMSNIQKLQDEFEPSLLDSTSNDKENTSNDKEDSESLVSHPTLDTKGLLQMEDKHSVSQVDDSELNKSMSGITKEEVEAGDFRHDEGTSTTTTISRSTSKAQQKKEDNLFWLVLRAFVIAVSKLWTK